MRLALFSVSYAGLWGQHRLDTAAFIARTARLGYDSVMLMGKRPHLAPLDIGDEHVAAITAALAKHRVTCDVIGGYTDLSGGGAAEVPYLEMQIAYIEALSRLAAKLGARTLRVFTAYESDTVPLNTAWGRVVTAVREMCDRAAAHGVNIAVQNHHDVAVHTDALLELLADIDRPNCRVGFDAWSPALRGEGLYESARRIAPHVAITTNADYVRLPRFRYRPAVVNYEGAGPDLVRAVKFGEGLIDYRAFFKGLIDGGFDGVATYEMCSPIRGGGSEDNLDHYAHHYVQWMRKHITPAGAATPDTSTQEDG